MDVLGRFEKAQVAAVASLHRQNAARIVAAAARVGDRHGCGPLVAPGAELRVKVAEVGREFCDLLIEDVAEDLGVDRPIQIFDLDAKAVPEEIGRASCRERV